MMSSKWGIKVLLGVMASVSLVLGLVFSFLVASPPYAQAVGSDFYQKTNLVSDQPGVARFTDPKLVNAWGITYGPTSPFWIADNHSGVSTLYNGNGQPFPVVSPLVVTVPLPGGGTSSPTGVVFNGTHDFVVSKGGKSGSSLFIFATEDGTISGWNPNVDLTKAILTVDNSSSRAVYKGLAIGRNGSRNLIFATDFHNGKVDVFDTHFHRVKSFTDRNVPSLYAPFGIQDIGGLLYVTFAKQKLPDKMDDEPGPHHGFVDVFRTDGTMLKRLISGGVLNSPWGLTLTPSNFGPFSHALLVGNFGDGTINAFDRDSGTFLGTLKDTHGNRIVIDGLWGLIFGNGALAGATNTLFFTAGPNGENHGLFGSIAFKH
jgi:uncharacterized protein (TIGR03118 family)